MHTSLGTEEPKTTLISMAAQTGAGLTPGARPGPGEELREPIFPVSARAGRGRQAAWKWKACSWGTDLGQAKEQDRDKGPKQEGEKVKQAGKGARDPEAVHKPRQEKGKKATACERKTGQGWRS